MKCFCDDDNDSSYEDAADEQNLFCHLQEMFPNLVTISGP